jgi:hypothetical protein
MLIVKKTPAYLQAEAKLPDELRGTLSQLVADWEAGCEKHVSGGRRFFNYNIFADLILAGWRKAP